LSLPDVMLLDQPMPNMDGQAVAGHIRAMAGGGWPPPVQVRGDASGDFGMHHPQAAEVPLPMVLDDF
jgi:CheY-like chemotaxis protein